MDDRQVKGQVREQVKYSFKQTSKIFQDAEERTQIQAQTALLSPPSMTNSVWRDDKHLWEMAKLFSLGILFLCDIFDHSVQF